MGSRGFLSNVLTQFRSLNRSGERIGVLEGFTRDFVDKRYTVFHKKGGKNNHFQGIERVGRHLLVTGSFPYGKRRADLLVFRLDTRPSDPGPWGSNLRLTRVPRPADALVNYYKIDGDYWHPGGLDLMDDIAVIPLERFDNTSVITFLDVSNPDRPVRLKHDIVRKNAKAGACAMTALADGRLLLAVWSDSDKVDNPRLHLDLYRSAGPDVSVGFTMVAQFFPAPAHRFARKYQSLDFVWQRSTAGESLYLIGFENTSEAQPNPLDPGKNTAYLFEVDLSALPNAARARSPATLPTGFLRYRDEREFETSGNWCNMDAGACAYVDSNQQLIVYSVFHFLAKIGGGGGDDPVFKCLEFRATDFSTVALIEDGWVDLYEQSGLVGRRLAILGPWTASIQDTSHVFADDLPFTVTRSVRYQLPVGTSFVLYPLTDFSGGPALVLQGSGEVKELDVLGTSFTGVFGSCRLLPTSVAIALPNAVIH
ncbi:MAG: hypothetical protein ACAI18_09325 [Gemmatimonadales bacterium]